jgi:hypothetical protein
MKWFRSNIKHGSRVALAALALQFVLTFGHCHALAAQAAPALQSGPTLSDLAYANGFRAPDAAGESAQQQPASNPESDQQKSDACPICAAIVLAKAMLLTTPPLLLLPQAVDYLYLATYAEFAYPNPAHSAFQPRAPPVS